MAASITAPVVQYLPALTMPGRVIEADCHATTQKAWLVSEHRETQAGDEWNDVPQRDGE